MNRRSKALTFFCLFFFSIGAYAYKQTTHGIIADFAADNSKMNDPDNGFLKTLGLGTSLSDPGFVLGQDRLTPKALIHQGVVEEDDGVRPFNHFFDPQLGGQGLPIPTVLPSPEWSLLTPGQKENQIYSYEDAKKYLYDALTATTSKRDRDQNLGLMFQSLGHVIHHLEDMSQPQHVRDDDHCDDLRCKKIKLYKPSSYEAYIGLLGTLPLDGYPTPDYGTFATPRSFWENSGKGNAEFTSKNFVSIRTNFRLQTSTPPPTIESEGGVLVGHPLPAGSEATLVDRDINDPTLLGPLSDTQPMAGDISFVQTPIRDLYSGAIGGPNTRASTLSILYSDLALIPGYYQYAGFTLNSLNYRAAAEYLIPRAAAYSIGLLDYFSRGQIKISLPDDGIYSIADHSTGSGFTKIKVDLKNATPSGATPQSMSGGTLVAIAKYTLNTCYESDLSGELEGGGQTPPSGCNTYFTAEEKISKSVERTGVNLPPEAEVPFTFDFGNDPIPFSARDLRFQVVYKGALGSEAGGIAIGSLDISAPTYFVILNSSDYFNLNGTFHTPQEIRNNPALLSQVAGVRSIDPAPLEIRSLKVIGKETLAGPITVPVRGYVRFALLLPDTGTTDFRMTGGFVEQGNTEEDIYSYDYTGVNPLLIRIANTWLPASRILQTTGRFRGVRGNEFLIIVKSHPPAVPPTDAALQNLRQKTFTDPGPTSIPVRFQ